MKKEMINFLLFLSLIYSIIFIYVILLPFKKIDDLFKTNFGNRLIDKLLWYSSKSPF